MPGSTTPPDRQGACDGAPCRVAFRPLDSVGIRDKLDFVARWLAYAFPYRRFAHTLAAADARLGGRCGSLFLHRSGLSPPYSLPVFRRTQNKGP